MKKYIQITIRIIKLSFAREMAHRGHFFLGIFGSLLWASLAIATPLIVVNHTNSLADGWGYYSILLLTSTFEIVNGGISSLFQYLTILPERVKDGELDYDLRTPLDAQFLSSIRFFNWDHVSRLLAGVIGVVIAILSLNINLSFINFLFYLISIILALILSYSLHLITVTFSFWLVGATNLSRMHHLIRQGSRYPPQVYGKALSFVFRFIIPLSFIAVVPARIISQNNVKLIFAAIFVTIIFLIISRKFWRFALRYYSSASS